MSKRSKIDPVEKVKIVERYLNGEVGMSQAGKELGVDPKSIECWICIYKIKGPVGLLEQSQNGHYAKELKLSAVNDYLNGKGSLVTICTKYGIRSERLLRYWLKVYNSGGTLKTSTGGTLLMND